MFIAFKSGLAALFARATSNDLILFCSVLGNVEYLPKSFSSVSFLY